MSTIRTTLNLNTDARNGTEYEVEIEVEYEFHRGFRATRTDPSEADTVEIVSIKVVSDTGALWPEGWLGSLLQDDDDLIALCHQDAWENRVAQEEYRAEARAEYLAEMKGGF